MKVHYFFFIVICLLMACSQEPDTIEAKAAIPSRHSKSSKILGILYTDNQELDRWKQYNDESISFIDSIQLNSIPSLELGKFNVGQESQQLLLTPIDSFYPFNSSSQVSIKRDSLPEFFFTLFQSDSTNNLQIDQLWIVPSRLNTNTQPKTPFAAGPVEIAKGVYLTKELRMLFSKQTSPK